LEKQAQKTDIPNIGKRIIYQINKVIKNCFGHLDSLLDNLPDPRKCREYSMAEIVFSGISMFLFKQESRNAYNNDRKDHKFTNNYCELFQKKLAHMDTVADVFEVMPQECLEDVKAKLIYQLFRKKTLEEQRFQGKYLVAIDGTGMVSFDHKHCDHCLTKTSKNGITTYFHNVLEAKLITASGISISLATEWICNEGKTVCDKQDCERMAFKRLEKKIKNYFPRLPIILLADGLYPWEGFFDICLKNHWSYIVTLQDKSLKTLQEEINWERKIRPQQQRSLYRVIDKKQVTLTCHWLSDLEYRNQKLNWVECNETTLHTSKTTTYQRFVHLTDLQINSDVCLAISDKGRLRQKIENEGFNSQKNHGYNLEHKFARRSFLLLKNFYQCLQIAHMINQLTILSTTIHEILIKDKKLSVKYLWKRMISFLLEGTISCIELMELKTKRFQIRLI